MPRRLAVLAILGALLAPLAGCAAGPAPATPTRSTAPAATPTPSASSHIPVATPTMVPPPPAFDRAALSVDDPSSLWVVVNKARPVSPLDFAPPDLVEVPVAHTFVPRLRREAADAVVRLFQAASDEAGLALASNSAYRSYEAQQRVYDSSVASNGQAFTDRRTARPGHSEHQTGLAIDIGAVSGRCSLDPCFGTTPEGLWLAANAWRFGFLLRYPADQVAVTGYDYEPWHFRYVGTPLAAELHTTGTATLEEFFGLPPAPGYP
ncbi:M15 family metallopeptidase [Naasia sp. SYSU D00948]|uniref:M15 family metallopeptidase n=1 Tax=Naasia sp. SYSU D00948 TaxID=2817379 RepID=UPI0027DD5098|nr:M15 family metallopeptidase [Naasia sp. SYSU D00948]